MTAVLGESRPITYYWDEPVSPTAVGPTPVIPPEPPAKDDSADVGYSEWSKVGEHSSTSQIAERFSGAFPAALFGLEPINDEAKEESLPALLANALRDLQEINDEADEEGIEPPSEPAMADADRLIRAIYDILPRQYLVELLPEGVIAITVPGGLSCPLGTVKRRSVMLLCESDGGALCSVNMNGEHRRKRYSNANQLPDRFLREALSELGQE